MERIYIGIPNCRMIKNTGTSIQTEHIQRASRKHELALIHNKVRPTTEWASKPFHLQHSFTACCLLDSTIEGDMKKRQVTDWSERSITASTFHLKHFPSSPDYFNSLSPSWLHSLQKWNLSSCCDKQHSFNIIHCFCVWREFKAVSCSLTTSYTEGLLFTMENNVLKASWAGIIEQKNASLFSKLISLIKSLAILSIFVTLQHY